MWKACGWIVDNFGAWSYQHFIHKFTFDYSQSYTDPFFQYFRILEGVIHISTAPTTKTTDFYYIFLYKHTHPAVRKGELSTIMKLVFDKADLVKSVAIAMKAVSGKTTMPILQCILIDASSSQIKFTSNDMELGIETLVTGMILERGIVALDAKIFLRS